MGADAGAQLAQGEGKLTYHDGTVYEGNFADGLRHGRGKLVEPCGDVYDGESGGKTNRMGKAGSRLAWAGSARANGRAA